MARTNASTSTRIDPTRPFYAAVGSVDVAVAIARSGLTGAQSRLAKVEFEPKVLAGGFQNQAKALPSKVEALVSDYVSDLSQTVNGTVDELNQQYVGLAARGRTLVGRIRRQEATQQAQAEVKRTVTRAKTTATQTKKAAGTARSSAKATGTSARTTAAAGTKAARGAAAKTGS